MKRLYRIKTEWSSNLDYLIGLIASDGCLSNDGRHIVIVSKDILHLEKIKAAFGLNIKVGMKSGGYNTEKIYGRLQIGDRNFYDFLLSIGLTQRKSKTISSLKIPRNYFADFYRGCIDGDGTIKIWSHPESKNIQFRVSLCSASKIFLEWVKEQVLLVFGINTGWIFSDKEGMHVLCYAKTDSFKILKLLYYDGVGLYLDRKYQIYLRASGAIGQTR